MGALFCAGCGAAVARGCGRCGAALGPDYRFCDSCGVAVEPRALPNRRLLALGSASSQAGRPAVALARAPTTARRRLERSTPDPAIVTELARLAHHTERLDPRWRFGVGNGRPVAGELSRPPDPPAEPSAADPRVFEWVQRLDAALCGRDWHTYRSLLAAEYVHRDHRLGHVGSTCPDDAVESERRTASLFGAMQPTEVVSVGPGRLAIRSGSYGSARVMPFVNLVAFDHRGIALRSETFDPHQMHRASALAAVWAQTFERALTAG